MTISLLTLSSLLPSAFVSPPFAPASTSPNSTSYSRPGRSPKMMITPSSVLSSIRISTRWVGTPFTVTARPFVLSASPTMGRRFRVVAGMVCDGCVEVEFGVRLPSCSTSWVMVVLVSLPLPLLSAKSPAPSADSASSVPHDPRSMAISSSILASFEVEDEEARMKVTETEVISRRTR